MVGPSGQVAGPSARGGKASGGQIDTQEEANQPLTEPFGEAWTPDLRIPGSDDLDYYQWSGYLPPVEFVAQLLVAQVGTWLRRREESAATEVYHDVLRRLPTGAVAPMWIEVR